MSSTEGSLVPAYCVKLVSSFKRLTHDLAIPLIDQELYAELFVTPLEEQQCRPHDASPVSSTFNLHSSISDMQADALISLGATELIVSALESHEKLSLHVLQAVELRESLLTRMWACCNAYNGTGTAASSEEARFTLLRLLQEHQLVTLLVVESVFEWREVLSRPYPFHLRGGENYLLSILEDCAALDTQPLVRSLTTVRLRQDPLCAKVDLQRMLHRLETTRRSRLITTGAMWNVGLQPLRPLQARGRSQSAEARSSSCLTKSARSKSENGSAHPPSLRTPLPRPPQTMASAGPHPPTPPQQRSADTARFPHFHGGRPEDFVSEVARLSSALKRHQSSSKSIAHVGCGGGLSSPLSRSGSQSSYLVAGASFTSFPAPHPPKLGESHEKRQRQHRLLAATRILERESALQRTVMQELYLLATKAERFVPLMEIPQLFPSQSVAVPSRTATAAAAAARKPVQGTMDGQGYPADSWVLDRTQWHTAITTTTESRIDRLSCMSTAREVLEREGLLVEWQQRMGRRVSGLSGPAASHSKGSFTTGGSTTPGEGSLTPLKSRRKGSRYSDFFERTSPTGASAQALDTRLPMLAAAEHSTLSFSSSSSSAPSSSLSGSSAPPAVQQPQVREEGDSAGQQTSATAAAHADGFSSDFESESTSSGDKDAAPAAAAAAGKAEDDKEKAPVSSRASSSSAAASSLSSTPPQLSYRPSLDEQREQLLAEHRLNSSSQSCTA